MLKIETVALIAVIFAFIVSSGVVFSLERTEKYKACMEALKAGVKVECQN